VSVEHRDVEDRDVRIVISYHDEHRAIDHLRRVRPGVREHKFIGLNGSTCSPADIFQARVRRIQVGYPRHELRSSRVGRGSKAVVVPSFFTGRIPAQVHLSARVRKWDRPIPGNCGECILARRPVDKRETGWIVINSKSREVLPLDVRVFAGTFDDELGQ